MFHFPRFPPRRSAVTRITERGCPIRTSSDRRLPAPPRRISSRGHVLHRPGAPRHPPWAHHQNPTARKQSGSRLRGARGDLRRPLPGARSHARGIRNATLYSQRASVTAGGAAGIRTPDLCRARAALSQTKLRPHNPVGAPGLEPGTSALSGPRSHHLSYAPGSVTLQHRYTNPVRRAEDEAESVVTRPWRGPTALSRAPSPPGAPAGRTRRITRRSCDPRLGALRPRVHHPRA